MEGEGKGDGHQHGRKPRIPEPVLKAWKLTYSEEVRGRWTPTGAEPMDQWMDGYYVYLIKRGSFQVNN